MRACAAGGAVAKGDCGMTQRIAKGGGRIVAPPFCHARPVGVREDDVAVRFGVIAAGVLRKYISVHQLEISHLGVIAD